MSDAICISFSSIVLVSLAMAQAILANCSSMDIVFIVITSIVTTNEEVEESKWLKKLSFFDILIGDSKWVSIGVGISNRERELIPIAL